MSGNKTGIAWTDRTWNPTTGCDKVSDGCDLCYALVTAARMKSIGVAAYQTDGDPRTSGPGFGLAMHPGRLDMPLRWQKPSMIFVNSMSDLFHPRVTDRFIAQVFAVMHFSPRHVFQVLTKREARLQSLTGKPGFVEMIREEVAELGGNPAHVQYPLPNVWLGVSAEDQDMAARRIPALIRAAAAVRFVSAEPLLSPLQLGRWLGETVWPNTAGPRGGIGGQAVTAGPGVDWVIVGGESGRWSSDPVARPRPMHPAWAESLRDQCAAAGTAFFFKQWGAWAPRGRLRDGEPLPVDNERTMILNENGRNRRGRAAGSLTNQLCEFPDRSWCEVLEHIGAKASGNQLAGQVHEQYPAELVNKVTT